MLADEAVTLEQCEDDTRLPARNTGTLRQFLQLHAFEQRILLEQQRDLRRFLHVRILAAEEIRLHAGVFDTIQGGANRRLPIATARPAS
jgi:hypothetical protein